MTPALVTTADVLRRLEIPYMVLDMFIRRGAFRAPTIVAGRRFWTEDQVQALSAEYDAYKARKSERAERRAVGDDATGPAAR